MSNRRSTTASGPGEAGLDRDSVAGSVPPPVVVQQPAGKSFPGVSSARSRLSMSRLVVVVREAQIAIETWRQSPAIKTLAFRNTHVPIPSTVPPFSSPKFRSIHAARSGKTIPPHRKPPERRLPLTRYKHMPPNPSSAPGRRNCADGGRPTPHRLDKWFIADGRSLLPRNLPAFLDRRNQPLSKPLFPEVPMATQSRIAKAGLSRYS